MHTTLGVLTLGELNNIVTSEPAVLIEKMIPAPGASLVSGPAKSCKTILAVQMGLSVATGQALFGNYKVCSPGPVLMIENDDPGGIQSIKQILSRTKIHVTSRTPFFFAVAENAVLGPSFTEMLEMEIRSRGPRLVILDSYTSLRPTRAGTSDIVKSEAGDLSTLDKLSKNNNCSVVLVHHNSKGAAGLDWSEQAAGSYAMTASTESQISVSRYRDLDTNSPERLVRVRGRHLEGTEMVLRFNIDTLGMDHVLEGGAASLYPQIRQLRSVFGTRTITPKAMNEELGLSRATTFRMIGRLLCLDVLRQVRYGEYALREQAQ